VGPTRPELACGARDGGWRSCSRRASRSSAALRVHAARSGRLAASRGGPPRRSLPNARSTLDPRSSSPATVQAHRPDPARSSGPAIQALAAPLRAARPPRARAWAWPRSAGPAGRRRGARSRSAVRRSRDSEWSVRASAA
jgi:hypothetical protein